MRESFAIAGLVLAFVLWTAPAGAAQDTPVPAPAPEQGQAKPKSTMQPMQLGTPANAPEKADKPDERKGVNLFGYKVFSKLDFGLDLLYGAKQQAETEQLEGSLPEDAGDGGLFSKLKKRF